jgi:hypothetical protein
MSASETEIIVGKDTSKDDRPARAVKPVGKLIVPSKGKNKNKNQEQQSASNISTNGFNIFLSPSDNFWDKDGGNHRDGNKHGSKVTIMIHRSTVETEIFSWVPKNRANSAMALRQW